MALRLTDAPEPERGPGAPAAAPAPAPAASEAQVVQALRARADALLTQRDLDAFADLWSEAAAIADPQRRYQARCVLAEAGLAAQETSVQVLTGIYAVVAMRTLEVLEEDPAEPRLLNLAGIAFYELYELQAADALFAAAERLQPELPGVAGNRAEVRRRRKGRTLQPKLPASVIAAMHQLVPRAKRVAASAKPATGLTLSLCMIVKDEEEMLPRCLAAAKDAVDEIIIVDTGSTDRTVEIAEEFGATVIEFPWTGSFSDARNVSFDAATCDWMMFLDADEVLVEGEAEKLRELTGRTWAEGIYLVEQNYTGIAEEGTSVTHNALRVFRNRPEYRFTGRLHEQIAHTLPGYLPERIENSTVRLEHYGYLTTVRETKDKSRRNLELLERQSEEGVDTAFHHYNLGTEYFGLGDLARSVQHYEQAWARVEADPTIKTHGFYTSLCGRYVQMLRMNGRYEDCIALADEVLAMYPDLTDAVLEKANSARGLGRVEDARRWYRQALEMGDAPSRYSANVGAGSFMALTGLAALERADGDLAEAERLLREVRVEYPQFLAAVGPLADIMGARGAEADEIVDAVEAGEELGAAGRFMLAVPLHERGAAEAAERQLRAALDKQPDSPQLLLALGETLLSQDRLDEAGDAVTPLMDHPEWAAQAARTLLFSRLAEEERDVPGDELDAALDAAAEARMDPADLALFRAWRGVRDGEAPGVVAPAAAGLALTMLEALLRLEHFDRFAELLPIVEAIALPWRERHERLATMYLRRGFLESAADEWAAVVNEAGPDVPALLGLAQVAAARGMVDDAQLFVEEARKLEPANPVASRMLEVLAG